MKIYFCGSIRGGREMAADYQLIIQELKKHATVLTEHLGSDEIIESKDGLLSDRQIHDRDMDWIRESNLLVAEVSVTSLGVGYEIGRALELGKPVLALFRKGADKQLSAMIAGSDQVQTHYYSETEELGSLFEAFFD